MTRYQVETIVPVDAGRLFVMTNGDSVLMFADGSCKCRNSHGLGFSANGRFAHIARAMIAAARKVA